MRFALVHLSDAHLAGTNNPLLARTQSMAAAICSTAPDINEYLVVLSGDIGNTGSAEDYATALGFLDELKRSIHAIKNDANTRFVTVPGNHDCILPEDGRAVRKLLIEGLRQGLNEDRLDDALLKSVLAPQTHYWEFDNRLAFAPASSNLEKLFRRQVITIDNEEVNLNLYNTALLSQREEVQGELSVPMAIIASQMVASPTCALAISVFHHPYGWIEQNTALAFRDFIEGSSDLVLTGHDHHEAASAKSTVRGVHVLCCEGAVLQERRDPGNSGFSVILFDTAACSRRIISFRFRGGYYERRDDTDWQVYSRTRGTFRRLAATKEFVARLSQCDIPLNHKSAGTVSLDTIFIDPDVTVRKLSKPENDRDISGAKLFEYLSNAAKCLIQGTALSGKTALAKTIAKRWLLEHQFYPLLVDGRDIKRADEAYLERFVTAAASESYGPENIEPFRQLAAQSKALLVDDWDKTLLSPEEQTTFLARAGTRFGKLFLFVQGFSYISHLLSRLQKTDPILEFDYVGLRDMSFSARGTLIDRWLALEFSPGSPEFSRKVEEKERLVKTVIGKNTLPSLPFVVLAILEASQRDGEALQENGSFGYLYEVLITGILNSSHSNKSQLEKKYNFLPQLAFEMFSQGEATVTDANINALLDRYASEYRIRVDKRGMLDDLVTARVLLKEDGNYSFTYPHLFHYFLARYFRTRINGSEAPAFRKRLQEIANGINLNANRAFLMFFVYLTHDEGLTDHLLDFANEILAESEESSLTVEIGFYNDRSTDGRLATQTLPQKVDLEASRKRRREQEDEQATSRVNDSEWRVTPEPRRYSSELPISEKLDYANSCMEALGQILRNFTGSIPGDRKLQILTACYRLGLRSLRTMLQGLEDVTQYSRGEFAKSDVKSEAQKQFIKSFERFLLIVARLLGAASLQRLSLNLGSPEIAEGAYDEVLRTVGSTNATKLINLAIKLDHYETYPLNEVRRLHLEFAKNGYADDLLKSLVISHMHTFALERGTRAAVLAIWGVKADDSILGKANKRFKP